MNASSPTQLFARNTQTNTTRTTANRESRRACPASPAEMGEAACDGSAADGRVLCSRSPRVTPSSTPRAVQFSVIIVTFPIWLRKRDGASGWMFRTTDARKRCYHPTGAARGFPWPGGPKVLTASAEEGYLMSSSTSRRGFLRSAVGAAAAAAAATAPRREDGRGGENGGRRQQARRGARAAREERATARTFLPPSSSTSIRRSTSGQPAVEKHLEYLPLHGHGLREDPVRADVPADSCHHAARGLGDHALVSSSTSTSRCWRPCRAW